MDIDPKITQELENLKEEIRKLREENKNNNYPSCVVICDRPWFDSPDYRESNSEPNIPDKDYLRKQLEEVSKRWDPDPEMVKEKINEAARKSEEAKQSIYEPRRSVYEPTTGKTYTEDEINKIKNESYFAGLCEGNKVSKEEIDKMVKEGYEKGFSEGVRAVVGPGAELDESTGRIFITTKSGPATIKEPVTNSGLAVVNKPVSFIDNSGLATIKEPGTNSGLAAVKSTVSFIDDGAKNDSE